MVFFPWSSWYSSLYLQLWFSILHWYSPYLFFNFFIYLKWYCILCASFRNFIPDYLIYLIWEIKRKHVIRIIREISNLWVRTSICIDFNMKSNIHLSGNKTRGDLNWKCGWELESVRWLKFLHWNHRLYSYSWFWTSNFHTLEIRTLKPGVKPRLLYKVYKVSHLSVILELGYCLF